MNSFIKINNTKKTKTNAVLLLAIVLIVNLSSTFSKGAAIALNAVDKQLAALYKEKADLDATSQLQDLANRAAEQKTLKAKLSTLTGPELENANKKLSLITQDYHVLSEIEQVQQQQRTLVEDRIKLLEEYKEDPEFTKLQIAIKASYSFDEFEELGRRVLYTKSRLSELEKSRIAAYDDLNKRKKARTALEEEYQEKKKQQEDFSRVELAEDNTRAEQGEIIDLQKKLLDDKKALASAKVEEAEQRIVLLDTHITILQVQLEVLDKSYNHVKGALNVASSYVQKAEEALERLRTESSAERERLQREKSAILRLKENMRKKAIEAAQRFNVPPADISSLRDWDRTPTNTHEWAALCTLGYGSLEQSVLDLEQEYKDARIEFEKAKIRKEEISVAIIRSWHALTHRRLGFSARDLEQQVKSYEAPKAEIQGDLARLSEKRNQAIASLQELNVALDRIKKLALSLKENQVAHFKDAAPQFELCNQRMHDAEDQTRRRMYLTAKLIEVYSTAIATLEDTAKRVENVVFELTTKSFWRRSDLSISVGELKNFFPDIKRFTEDAATGLLAYFKGLSVQRLKNWINYYNTPKTFVLLIIRLIGVLTFFLFLRRFLPRIRNNIAQKRGYVPSALRLTAVVLLDFINQHLKSLYLWVILYSMVAWDLLNNVYISLVFYILSIPYAIYIVYKFIQSLMKANDQSGSIIVSQSYKARFLMIIPPLLYTSIALFFFRQAFLIGNYHASAVPAILLAVNYIVLQLALMSLISKEWILSLIPRTTPLWEWIYDKVSQYYYVLWLILITVIVMSNPYVGYGRQVLYVLSRLIIIGLLIPLLSYIYTRVRRVSSDLFFYYGENESIVERFSSARTWYGFFVVVMFCSFILLSLVLGAKVLGYPFGFRELLSWLQYELWSPGFDEMGKRISVTPVALFNIVLFLIAGMVTAYVVNTVLLRRIFDPLLVSSGIQNTIFTFSRYTIIFIFLLLSLKSVGLESFGTKLAIVLGGIGFAVKEPLLDFFSYFIILVQRPIKIGDLIQIDEHTTGIVRHLTPRSVVLRRKNSVTVIVPNSYFITKPVVNWNYSRTFFALSDIFLTVPYSTDPDKVRSLILKVLDSNLNILKTPSPIVLLHDFVDNGFQFMIRGYVTADKVLEQWEISSALRLDIVRALRAATIEVASPTRVLKVLPNDNSSNNEHNGSNIINTTLKP